MTQPPNPVIQTTDNECRDADQLGEIYGGTNFRYLRSKAGPFHSQMKKVVLGDLTFHTNHHESSMLMEGANSDDLIAVGFQSPESKPRLMMGEPFTSADVFLAGPRAEHLATVSPGQQTLQIFVPKKLLEHEIASRLHRDPIDFTNQRYLLKLGANHVRQLIDIVALAFQAAHDLKDSAPSPAAMTQMQKTFVEQVVTVLMSEEYDPFRDGTSFSSTGWSVLQARDFLEEHAGSPVRIAEVCRALGVSQRTLQVAFAEGLGVSPMRYLKLHRLHLVRTRLKQTSAEDVAIRKAAREAGFVDLSRFARDYKELFGQLPSETPRG